MANWCKYCKGPYGFLSSYFTCNITGTEVTVSSATVENCCKNNGYKCDRYSTFGPSQSSCFITTITCEILNKKDNDEVMDNLRKFRDEVLQEDEKYYDILKEYDAIGPAISNKIKNDPNKEQIANVLYENVLVGISDLVSKEQNDIAVEKYYQMTLMLINYYGLKHDYNDIKDDNYGIKSFDPKKLGHGKKLNLK